MGTFVNTHAPDLPLDERALSKLRWRCRRGMLENDLLIERFFRRFEAELTTRHGLALNDLMNLSDNDLLDLQLGRLTLKQVDPTLDRADVIDILGMLRDKL